MQSRRAHLWPRAPYRSRRGCRTACRTTPSASPERGHGLVVGLHLGPAVRAAAGEEDEFLHLDVVEKGAVAAGADADAVEIRRRAGIARTDIDAGAEGRRCGGVDLHDRG